MIAREKIDPFQTFAKICRKALRKIWRIPSFGTTWVLPRWWEDSVEKLEKSSHPPSFQAVESDGFCYTPVKLSYSWLENS